MMPSLRSTVVALSALLVSVISTIAGFPGSGVPSADASPGLSYIERADDYWLGRQNLENVRKGIGLLREDLDKNSRDYEAWWRVSKLDSFIARHSSGSERNRALNDGISAA